jgi:hypothetical protein
LHGGAGPGRVRAAAAQARTGWDARAPPRDGSELDCLRASARRTFFAQRTTGALALMRSSTIADRLTSSDRFDCRVLRGATNLPDHGRGRDRERTEAHVKKNELGRRDLLGRAGIAFGGALAFGALQACGDDSSDPQPQPQPQQPVTPQVSDFPYEKHLSATFVADGLDVTAVKQAAYAGYFQGGCCHGAYSALLGDLQRAGAPFTSLPLAFGKFGGGGVDGYGSICGAALGAILVMNMVVENAAERKKLVTTLLRWYEGFAFPAYVPTTSLDPAGKTLAFEGDTSGNPAALAVIPGSHLCHASVSGWCHANGDVDANGADKKARCARLTADVAGKAAELMNAFLASGAYGARTASAPPALAGNCMVCHNNSQSTPTVDPVVATGMECGTCHTTHTVAVAPEACGDCHTETSFSVFPPDNVAH